MVKYFKHFKSLSWTDYYEPSNEIHEIQNEKLSYSLQPTEGNAYVYNCYFQYLSASAGGAILYSVDDSNLLVEKCSIYNCTAGITAGIRVSKGNSVIAFVCGQKCSSNGNDGFCSIWNSDPNRIINSIFDSSISHCEAKETHIIYHDCGHIYITSVNISYNKAKARCGIACLPDKINQETSHGNDIIYCSFLNNTATNQLCVFVSNYYNSSCTNQIKNCNIIGNNANNTIHSKGETILYHCSILNNVSPYFSLETAESKNILSMCYLDKESGLGSVSQTENQISDQFIHSLSFIETGKCVNHFYQRHCTENSLLQNLYIHKIIIPSPFIFLLLSNRK